MPHESSRLEDAGHLRRALLAFTPAIVALFVGLVAFDAEREAQSLSALVAHTRDVIDISASTFSALQDAETGQRGYVITGKPEYLAPYKHAFAVLREDTAALRSLLRSNAVEEPRLDTLGGLIARKQSELAETIRLRRDFGFSAAAALVSSDSGKKTMDTIRTLLSSFNTSERSVLEARRRSEESHRIWARVALAVATLLAVMIALVVNRVLIRFAENEAALAHDLESQNMLLQEQGLELEMQAQQLQEQAAELEVQNEELQTSTDALIEQTRAAQEANRAKSDFLAMMSHELRTPLNAIAGYTQLMQLGVPAPVPDAFQTYLSRIQHSQSHLLGIINSVLNFARLEAGTIDYRIGDVAVGDIVATLEALIAPQMAARGLGYSCEPCAGLVVRADEEKMTQVLLNVLSNAIKFTPRGGAITISAARETRGSSDVVAIRVRDTGPGIPPDMLESIFAPFVQVDTSRTRNSEGTGLGLAIARDLARNMSGELTCESAVGAGSTFTLTLPSVEAVIAEGPPDQAPTGSRPSGMSTSPVG